MPAYTVQGSVNQLAVLAATPGQALELLDSTEAVAATSVDLWVRSSARDTDLEVTISEVRKSGREVDVQSGWLRASRRRLDWPETTAIRPAHTYLAADARPMPKGAFRKLRVELFPFAHAFRAGSRVRITVDVPGNACPLWAFDTISSGEKVEIAIDRVRRSKVVLPVVPGMRVPGRAPGRVLRGRPCRTYRP